MNEAAAAEYDTMLSSARDVNDQMAQLRDKCAEHGRVKYRIKLTTTVDATLQPQLMQIDQVVAGVNQVSC